MTASRPVSGREFDGWVSAADLGLFEDVEPEPWERTAPAPPRSDRKRNRRDRSEESAFSRPLSESTPVRARKKDPPRIGG
jgi:hypothetical protein